MADLLSAWAIVVGAGDGARLGADRPKAFVALGDRVLLAHSVELLEEHPAIDGVVLVVPEGWEEPASLLADDLAAGKVTAAVAGGATRSHSVAAGLAEVPDDTDLILVHDAARPFASAELVSAVLAALGDADGAVPGVPVADTIKRVEGGRVAETPDRSQLVAVQTPQAFTAATLRRAYAQPPEVIAAATDCASLVEASGGSVAVVSGEPDNIKITTAADLERARERLAGAAG
ncbi:MAG TPA: 2-C-methyl-D-erythritol 4-phosphate cytidylyltransferase [Gaiellales bacterium]|nr:2-C-methyl-D-erythritol 4-phosphate cytidylyltransferase [Gaiellales bacterium]